MDDAESVRVVEGAGHFAGDADRFINRQLTLPVQPVAQRLALHVRHHVEQRAVGFARVVQRQDVRVTELGGELDLAQEALAPDRRGDVFAQHLDGHVAIVPGVVRQVHGGHAALPKLALDAVARAKGNGELLRRAHRGTTDVMYAFTVRP